MKKFAGILAIILPIADFIFDVIKYIMNNLMG